MKTKIIIVFLFVLMSLGIFASSEFYIPKTEKPVIDGIINNDEWAGTCEITGLHTLNSNHTERNRTIFWMGYDDENIYMAFRSYGKTKPNCEFGKLNNEYWLDDSIEMYLVKDYNTDIFYQIVASCGGKYVILCNDGKGKHIDDSRGFLAEMDVDYKAKISEEYNNPNPDPEKLYWEGEIRVSLKSFKYDPKDFAYTSFLLARNNQDERYYAAIGYVLRSYYEKENYTKISFGDSKPFVRMGQDTGTYTVVNTTKDPKEVKIKKKLTEFDKILSETEEKITLAPGTSQEIKTEYPKGVITSDIRIECENMCLYEARDYVFNTDFLKYNYDREKDKFIIDLNTETIPPKTFSYVDMRLMKDTDVIFGTMINVSSEKKHYEIDMKKYPAGKYKFICNIKNINNYEIEIIK